MPEETSTGCVRVVVASEGDIDLLVRMRMDFIHDMHSAQSEPARFNGRELEEDVRRYIRGGYAAGTYIGYAGFIGETPVCSAGLLLYCLPPMRAGEVRTQGHVLNFYTIPDYRRRGIGRALIDFMITDARSRGISRLYLNATRMGEPVYRKSGFHEPEETALIREL